MYQRGPGEQELFLLRDTGADQGGGRILIFGTNANLDNLEASQDWFADGTFRESPPLFAQVYTIHSARLGQILPAVYALLPNKQGATYNLLFQALKQLRTSRRKP